MNESEKIEESSLHYGAQGFTPPGAESFIAHRGAGEPLRGAGSVAEIPLPASKG
jgi:hypothetical protein